MLVDLESPYAGDIEGNVAFARACMRDCLHRGEYPIASHLLYTQPGILDDGIDGERDLGIAAGKAWAKLAQKTVVYTDRGITPGMQYGIDNAITNGRPVEYRTLADTSPSVKDVPKRTAGVSMTGSTKWDRRFMDVAKCVATWSKDRSTQVACVIVSPERDIVATGYNGFPRGVDDDVEARHDRPLKYKYAEHSERNAIYSAARLGKSVRDCTVYIATIPGGLPPCCDCARAMIQSGISTVVLEEPDFENPRWGEDTKLAYAMLLEAGVEVRTLTKDA